MKRNQPFLKAFADIRYSGSGLLKGYWEADGRMIEYVNLHLVYGTGITLASPEVPSLPTFSPGTHIIRFIISEPDGDVPTPQALYFVTAEESGEIRTIGLIHPADDSEVDYSPVTLNWQNVSWADTYLIVFFVKTDEKPIFSAYVKDNTYQIPPYIFHSLFTPMGKYLWRVRGYDSTGNILGESGLFRFVFTE